MRLVHESQNFYKYNSFWDDFSMNLSILWTSNVRLHLSILWTSAVRLHLSILQTSAVRFLLSIFWTSGIRMHLSTLRSNGYKMHFSFFFRKRQIKKRTKRNYHQWRRKKPQCLTKILEHLVDVRYHKTCYCSISCYSLMKIYMLNKHNFICWYALEFTI